MTAAGGEGEESNEAAKPTKRPIRKRPPQQTDFDLNLLSQPEHDVVATMKPRESRQEATARIAREDAEQKHQLDEEVAEGKQRRLHATILLIAFIGIVGLSFLSCLWIVVVPGYPPELTKWSSSILTAIVSGGVGVLVGGKIFPPKP